MSSSRHFAGRREMTRAVIIAATTLAAAVAAMGMSMASQRPAGRPGPGHVQPAQRSAPASARRPYAVIRRSPLHGVPPFVVVLDQATGGRPAQVMDVVTGHRLGQVRTPVARSSVEWAAAAADDRTFVLADQSQTLTYRFYLLRLAADGQPG